MEYNQSEHEYINYLDDTNKNIFHSFYNIPDGKKRYRYPFTIFASRI